MPRLNLVRETVCGPMYSAVGKDHLEDPMERQKEWQRAVSQESGKWLSMLKRKDVKLALEPLNRFETDMINVVSQGLKFIDETGMDNVGFHLDTFHMHLEEKNSAEAIRQAGNKDLSFPCL